MDELIAKFSPEPEFYLNSVFPKMQELQRDIEHGDAHRENGETFAAEYEYSRALKVDEENVRANFGIGLTYLERGDNAKAEDIFHRLVKLDATFEPEHKHLFNEFGINLRKSKMLTESMSACNPRETFCTSPMLCNACRTMEAPLSALVLVSSDVAAAAAALRATSSRLTFIWLMAAADSSSCRADSEAARSDISTSSASCADAEEKTPATPSSFSAAASMGVLRDLRQIGAGRVPNPWPWRLGNWAVAFLLTAWLSGAFH